MLHIGSKIKEVLKAKHYGITVFAEKINKSRTVVYNIFERESIDSHLLYKISDVLDFNFFNLYNSERADNKLSEVQSKYGDGWKIKYFDLLEKHNVLLENKIEAYVLSSIDGKTNSMK